MQLDLASPATVERIELVVAQDPAGPSTHELWLRLEGGDFARIQVFEGVTHENDVLVWEPDVPMDSVTGVRVVTTAMGDPWRAWHEILVYSPDPLN